MTWWKKIWVLVHKDLMAEWRSKEILSSTVFFAVLVLMVFNFSFEGAPDRAAAGPGILWVAFLFAGLLGMNRLFLTERENGALEGLMLCPVDRPSLYVAKWLSLFVILALTEAITLALFILFFNVPVANGLWSLALVILLGTVGLAALGTSFAAMAVRTRTRELMLPMLLIPIAVPLLMAAVKCTSAALGGHGLAPVRSWMQLLLAFDAIFLAVGYATFPSILEE
ncbi:MAG: heme exporter protein CcmB [Acidobacteriota bacterium]